MEKIRLISLILNPQSLFQALQPPSSWHLSPSPASAPTTPARAPPFHTIQRKRKGPNLVLFVICILPGTKSRMTSTQYKTNKRLSRSELRPTRGLSSARRRRGKERAGGGSADAGGGEGRELRARPRSLSVCSPAGGESGTTPPPTPNNTTWRLFLLRRVPAAPGPGAGLGDARQHVQHRQHPGHPAALQGRGAPGGAQRRGSGGLPGSTWGLALWRGRWRLFGLRRLLPASCGPWRRGPPGRGRRLPPRLQQLLLRAAARAGGTRGSGLLRGCAAAGRPAVLLRPDTPR